MNTGDKVKLITSDYEKCGFSKDKTYELVQVGNAMVKLLSSDGSISFWVQKDRVELVNEGYAPCSGGCGKEAWTVDFYCTDIPGACPGPAKPTPEMINKAWENVGDSYTNPVLNSILNTGTETQSKRFNSGKVQTREIDPSFILGIGEVLTKSREKYDHFNWCKPTKLSTPYESMMRHILAFQSGEDFDKETEAHHLLHAATNLMFMYYHITNNPEESDDRFFKKVKK